MMRPLPGVTFDDDGNAGPAKAIHVTRTAFATFPLLPGDGLRRDGVDRRGLRPRRSFGDWFLALTV